MDVRRALRVVAQRWWLVAIGPLLGGAIAFGITSIQPRIYSTTALLFVNQAAAAGAITYNDALLSQQLVKTYSQMAAQPVVLEEVRRRLGLPYDLRSLNQMVSVRPVVAAQLFEIVVSGENPAQISDIANGVARAFMDQQKVFFPEQQSAVRVAQPALVPVEPISPRPVVNLALGLVGGIILASGVVRFLEYLDDTVKTSDDLERATGLQTLALVTNIRAKGEEPSRALLTHRDGEAVEAYRLLRTNLEFTAVGGPLRVLLITSSGPQEGKTTTASNLAVALARAGKSVIVVDADLRRPSLHNVFDTQNEKGLSSFLLSPDDAARPYLQPSRIDGLFVLPAGLLPPNPAELLASWRFPRALERLREDCDLVILDSPPVLSVADAISMAAHVDGTIMVVDTRRTRPGTVQQGAQALARSGTRILGGVLNKVSERSAGHYYYYYRYHADGVDGAARRTRTRRGAGAQNGEAPAASPTAVDKL